MYRFRIVFAKEGEFACLSHLELQRTFIRALRRAAVPMAYSQGFNPQPRLSFAAPLAVGIESDREYLEVDLAANMECNALKQSLNCQLPPALAVQKVQPADPLLPALAAQVEAALYLAVFSSYTLELAEAVQALATVAVLDVERPAKDRQKKVNIRPFIYNLCLQNASGEGKLFMFLATGNRGGARPSEIIDLLPRQNELQRVRRLSVFIAASEGYITPEGEPLSFFCERPY
jgi:radical SAM-linked protein